MAEEELDWGVEDVGAGVAEYTNGTTQDEGVDEDVLSLGGDERKFELLYYCVCVYEMTTGS